MPPAPAAPRPCGHIHRHSGSPSRHSGESRNLCLPPPLPQGVRPYSPSFRLPQPSYRLPNRHSGASRNLCLPTPLPQGVRPYSPSFRFPQQSFRLPQPSFRRKPESMLADSVTAGRAAILRFATVRRTFSLLRCPYPSFRRKPESMIAGYITVVGDYNAGFRLPQPSFQRTNRHSGASRNLCLPTPLPWVVRSHSPSFRLTNRHSSSPAVIPAHQPSFRRKPESMLADSNTVGRAAISTVIPSHQPSYRLPPTVIPAKAGIYACRLRYRSRRLRHRHSGESRNDGCRGITMMKTYAGLR